MTTVVRFEPVFVEFIPDDLREGELYVSMRFRTTAHLCACGCGEEVAVPLGRHEWSLHYDGEVTLRPSIGSWGLPCRSHYFIRRNDVIWARRWSDEEIAAARGERNATSIGLTDWVPQLARRLKGRATAARGRWAQRSKGGG